MKGIREVVAVTASAGIIAALLTFYFDWRERLLKQIRGRSPS
jgi:hypothetical protein